MKPQSTGIQRRSKLCGTEAVLCFQEELVSVIHGAFEVAVDIAVREVKTLVSQATGDIYKDLQRENESLRQKLRRAEALLDSARFMEEDNPGSLFIDQAKGPKQREEATCSPCSRQNTHPKGDGEEVKGPSGERGEGLSSDRDGMRRCEDPPSEREKQNDGAEVTTSQVCSVKVESIVPVCRDPPPQDSAPPPSIDSRSTLEGITIKLEEPEEETDGPTCCLDLIKEEDLSLEDMKWPPEVPDVQSSGTELFNNKLDQAHPPNLNTSLLPTDLQSISSEFPNIFHLADPGVASQAPPHVYGVHVRTSRNAAALHACKFCGQSFHLPSLLRRHYGQCRQRLQQRCQQPVAGGTRSKLQLYPPGCSPFRCTVCNREFNRLENLKTHLRIHTGERPYTCSVCSKCFRHSGALTRHFRIHTGEKPYICGQCGKSFRNCGGLKFHQRSHNKHLQ